MPQITQLDNDTTPNNNDLLVTVDMAAGTTKNISREQFFTGAPLPANTVNGQAIADGAVTASKTTGIWWEEIGRTTLSSVAGTMSVAGLPYRKYLKVLISAHATGGTVSLDITLNGATSGYARRRSENGAAEATVASAAQFFTYTPVASQSVLMDMDIVNIASREKLGHGMLSHNNTNGASNLPTRIEFASKWANTTAAISSIQVANGGNGNFAEESEIIVLGHN